MAIKKESLKKLLLDLKIGSETEVDELISSADEKDVSLPEGAKVFSKEDYNKLLENQKNEGIKVGKEISIKELKEVAGLDFEGKKAETFLESYRKKVIEEANIKPDDRLKEKEDVIKELREKLKKEMENTSKAAAEGAEAKRDAQLLGMFHQKRNSTLSDDDRLTLLKKRYEFTNEDGKESVKDLKTGKFIQNDTLENLGWQAVLDKHFTESKWIEEEQDPPKGPGFNSSKKIAGAINNMREFRQHCEEQGWNINGEQAQAKLNEVTKENANFTFSE